MKYKKYLLLNNFVFLLTCFVVNPTSANESRTLFTRLGGMEQITAVVSETIDRTSENPKAARIFEGIQLGPVKASVAQHLCAISGGPCKYEGAPMAKAHTGLAITYEQFEIMDTYLNQALSTRGVSQADRAELGKMLGKMKSDVVGR